MPQQEMTAGQELTAGGGGNTGSGSFTTGSKCLSSGTFVAENKYLRQVIALAAGEVFPAGCDGKKVTWVALTTAVATSRTSDGGFTSVKVSPGTI